MTDPFGDILAAISYGQDLSTRINGFNRAQGSRLAWEQALLDAGAQLRDPGAQGQPQFSETTPASTAAALALPLPGRTGGTGVSGAVAPAPGAVPTTPAAAQLQARGQAAPLAPPPPVAGATGNPLRSPAGPVSAPAYTRAAPAPPPSAMAAAVEPRAVRLLMGENGFQVVIRDAGLDEAALRQLIGRVQSVVGETGAPVNRIIVNGLVAWEDASSDGDESQGFDEERVLEVLL